jgi:hypothetical protein
MGTFKQLLKEDSNDIIEIYKSETTDTRTSDWTKVPKDLLLSSSKSHIADVQQGLNYFAKRLRNCAGKHDHDKFLI